MKGFLVAGTSSGVGKTTVSLALIAALQRRGHIVQPFKSGPDFLDTGHLSRISGRTARNVDTWMLPASANLDVVSNASQGADTILVEGMMGLFDGKSGDSEVGSSAEIAKLLKLPVVLVLDAGKSARSIAAVVLGFEMFDPGLPLAGVLLNRVASERHYQLLHAAIAGSCKTPILGWLPRDPAVTIPERHLGLHTSEEMSEANQRDAFADLAVQHVDLDRLSSLECGLDLKTHSVSITQTPSGLRIGVARDSAFSFYYEDNLDLLREQGAEIIPFSPIADSHLPPRLDALYFGGGYPELYAKQLGDNQSMIESLRAFVSTNNPVYAECGGMIYLSQRLTTADGVEHPLAAILPFNMEMTDRLVHFGYVTVELTANCLLGSTGTILRGHSFHYSRITNEFSLPTTYSVNYSLSGKQENEGYLSGNVLASYIHLHFRSSPAIATHFVQAARNQQVEAEVLA
jgi:cobyrinic acid a,c-diamide synthase